GSHDGFRHVAGSFSVVLELHRVGGATLRCRAQRSGVAEHFRQRDFGLDSLAATDHVVHALDHAATRGQIAHHGAGVVFGSFHFHGHHGLEDHGVGLAAAFLETEDGSHLERQFVRVHIVVRTEVQRDLDVDHRVAGQHALRHGFVDTLFDRGDVFARNHTALDGVDELDALAGFVGFDLQHHVAILTLTTRLAHELAFGIFDGLADGFAVGHLGLADVGFDTEFALHAVNDDFQVQLAHTGDDGLTRFFVG